MVAAALEARAQDVTGAVQVHHDGARRLRDDRVVGVIESTICYRERKIDCLETFMAREDWEVSAEDRHFYSDSINDLPLLAAVGHPHVVNPDARLAAEAEARGWPVLSWKR